MTYLLDSNVFIEAATFHYGIDFCPAFWDWMAQANNRGVVFSTDMVRDELIGRGDDLSAWVARAQRGFFVSRDGSEAPSLTAMRGWAATRSYSAGAQREFFTKADSFLVAQASAWRAVVVTREVPAPESVKAIKIPDACRSLGVDCIQPWEMLRREHARFVMPPEQLALF